MYAATDEATSGAVGEMTESVWVAVYDAVDDPLTAALDQAIGEVPDE